MAAEFSSENRNLSHLPSLQQTLLELPLPLSKLFVFVEQTLKNHSRG
jgi:hypothetical protein